jgi:LPXTG-motif cell wall-anchored protein
VRTALGVRQTYLDKARAELPAKRTRREELQGQMATEDAVLEAVNLKKMGRCHCRWRWNVFQVFVFLSLPTCVQGLVAVGLNAALLCALAYVLRRRRKRMAGGA